MFSSKGWTSIRRIFVLHWIQKIILEDNSDQAKGLIGLMSRGEDKDKSTGISDGTGRYRLLSESATAIIKHR